MPANEPQPNSTDASSDDGTESAVASAEKAEAAPQWSGGDTIEVRNLTVRYGALRAVDDISFVVGRGEVVGFLGPNGAGKSTTMRVLCGLQAATSGEAWVCERSVARDPGAVCSRIGYMPESNPLPLDLRVIEYLRFRGRLKGLRGKRLKQRIEEVLEICDLDKKARRRVIGNLSKGFRQRVGIAEAILAEPELLIMDEPTIGLDPHQIQGIRQLINDLRGSMTVILSSHILPEIEMCCDRVIIINHGKLVAQGTHPELRETFIPDQEIVVTYRGPADLAPLIASGYGDDVQLVEDLPRNEPGLRRAVFRVEAGSGIDPEGMSAAFLREPDVKLAGLELVEPSLEHIFLAATRAGWKTSQAIGGTFSDQASSERTSANRRPATNNPLGGSNYSTRNTSSDA